MKNITMMDPTNLEKVIDVFFALREKDNQPITIPGLALACGFSKSGDILDTLREAAEGTSTYPDRAVFLLTRAVTRIEDHCLVNGLNGRFSAPLSKFCLGAYHNVKDTNEQTQNVTQLAIVFSDPDAPAATPKAQIITQAPKQLNSQQAPAIVFESSISDMVAAL